MQCAAFILCLKSCCGYAGIYRAPASVTNNIIMLYLRSSCGYPGICRSPAPIINSNCRAPAAPGALPVVLLAAGQQRCAAGRGCVPTAAPSAGMLGCREQPSVPACGTGSCGAHTTSTAPGRLPWIGRRVPDMSLLPGTGRNISKPGLPLWENDIVCK